MGLRINTNIDALSAQKSLNKSSDLLSKSLSNLSSGLRINKAADDASGLAIADTLKAQHTGIGQAIANANDGINIVQTADLALEESINIVNTIRTKSIQSASDGQTATTRKAIQQDVNKLLEELSVIGSTTAFNGQKLLDGSFINKSFHVGAYKGETVSINISDARANKIGAMASATTARKSEGAVSSPFLKGSQVTDEAIANDGDIRINGVEIGANVTALTTFGSVDSAWSKANSINSKTNTSGVQAKASTEMIVSMGGAAAAVSGTLNAVDLSAATTAATLISLINTNTSFQAMGIAAEKIGTSNVRITATDGRNLQLAMTGGAGNVLMNGAIVSAATVTQRGTLTLSNAKTMVGGDTAITTGTINSGDLLINGVDIAAGGSLTIGNNDNDHKLINAINNNTQLQKLGVRAELYTDNLTGAANGSMRLRLISNSSDITINGKKPGDIAKLYSGTTSGTTTTGIILEGNVVDSNMTEDNYLRTIGMDGAKYGSQELTGINNTANNDVAVISKAYLKTSQVTDETLVLGDIRINGTQVGASIAQGVANYGSSDSAWSKSDQINTLIDTTGVQARATTEMIVSMGGAAAGVSGTLQGVDLSAATTRDTLASVINNNASFQAMGITAEKVGTSNLRIKADDGRTLQLAMTGGAGNVLINGAIVSAATVTQRGTLSLSNARAMTNGSAGVTSGTLNIGELTINGIDVASSGALTVGTDDNDRTLTNAINNNEDLQKLGIRAEKYYDGATSRIRLVSTSSEITIGGTDPNKIAHFNSGTTTGKVTTEIKIQGAANDTNKAEDNYLQKIGLLGNQYGTAEEDGSNNTANNDILYFGRDRLSYNSGDVNINGYNLGKMSDDGISDAYGDKSAAAAANAINLVKDQTGVEADIIKASQTGKGVVTAGTLQQRDIVINGVDIIRDNSGGSGMELQSGDADHTLMDSINEYADQTGVRASVNESGKLVLSATDGRNIHVQSTSNGNKYAKFEADFGANGVAQDSVYFGNVRLVSDSSFKIDGSGSSASGREVSLKKLGLDGGGASTGATSDLKGDGTILAGLNYKTAMASVDLTTQEGAEIAIRSSDYALKQLDHVRGTLGSTQNQLTSTIANLSATKVNIQSSESTIRDVNFAEESSNFSKMQVLMQAGTYALSQANASSQNVMRLLQ